MSCFGNIKLHKRSIEWCECYLWGLLGGCENIKGNKDNEFLLVEGMTVGVVHTQKIKRETSARCQAFVFGVWQRQIIRGGRSWGEGGFEYSLLWSED